MERTIRCVLAQSHKPLRWVIVNDGSTDRTAEVAEGYAKEVQFIQVVQARQGGEHAFSSKARAFNIGLEQVRELNYEFVGNLDADISIEPNYFAALIAALERNERLGITGGKIYTKVGDRFLTSDNNPESVAGAVQFFRAECMKEVGPGYLPLPYGGIDAAAEIIARMKGWTVEKLAGNPVYEHRQTGTASASPLFASFRLGRRFHSLGYGFLFFSLRCFYRIGDPPVVVGSLAMILGYLESMVRRRPISLPADVVSYLRREHREKLLRLIRSLRRRNES